MKCLPMNKCCCGYSLRKGSIVIGLIFSVLALLTTVGLGSAAEHLAKEKGEVNSEVSIYIAATVAWACFTLADLLMIIGATREIPCLLIIWVVSTTLNLLIYVVLYAYLCVEISKRDGGSLAVVMTVLTTLILVCLFVYCILVVVSYYLKIVASRNVIDETPPVPDPNARRWR